MKKQENVQNVIVKLDFNKLNEIIRRVDKNGRLLGSQGIYSDTYSEINDQIILHRFAFLKGTIDAIDLLGIILDSIDSCLKFTYYFKYKDINHICNGYYNEDGIYIDNIMIGMSIAEGDLSIYYNIVYDNEKEILYEVNKMSKYYKEYYTRLFDRGRTVK